jgi:hypothetical protein
MILPNMYWLPKLHKTPIGSRFIVAAAKCSLKPLDKAVTSVLRQFYKQIENYNKIGHFFSGVKTFWVIQDNQPTVNAIKNINTRRNAKSVTSFDFSTLYTKIPHESLKDKLNELTDFCFRGCANKSICITKHATFWVDNKEKRMDNALYFSKNTVKLAISYLLDNCFFSLGNDIFRQRIGIPMGSDPAPFMANLFLYSYESSYLEVLKKQNKPKARRFGNVFRFIDDLCAINDGGEFEKSYRDIYPPELELKKENEGTCKASFLDLDMSISKKTFNLKLYDKRDAFPFPIVRMPYISNNMPSRIFYSTIGGEILRIARCTTNVEDFERTCRKLIDRMYYQGAEISRLKKTINKIYDNHIDIFHNFYKTPLKCVRAIFMGTDYE